MIDFRVVELPAEATLTDSEEEVASVLLKATLVDGDDVTVVLVELVLVLFLVDVVEELVKVVLDDLVVGFRVDITVLVDVDAFLAAEGVGEVLLLVVRRELVMIAGVDLRRVVLTLVGLKVDSVLASLKLVVVGIADVEVFVGVKTKPFLFRDLGKALPTLLSLK